jgi:hypothetical protein
MKRSETIISAVTMLWFIVKIVVLSEHCTMVLSFYIKTIIAGVFWTNVILVTS